MSDLTLLLGIAASTLLSEDAACVAAGVLVQQGAVTPVEGVAACGLGIYAGDALLWSAGRLMRNVAGAPRRAAWWRPVRLEALVKRADSPAALLASRFMPGARLPLYLAAGAFGRRPGAFFLWTLVAVAIWTPAVVLGTASTLAAGLLLVAAVRVGGRIRWRGLGQRIAARLDRWRRWEFWPSMVLYVPVLVHIARLALRHGGVGTLAAANPAIPEGGFVGESKFHILAQLPRRWTLDAFLIEPGGVEARAEDLRRAVEVGDFSFPLILKPDAGQRGVGVRLVYTLDEARAYFAAHHAPVVAQRYHPGPFEAGVFYYRRPDEPRGHIFSITDKRFPVLVGDGVSTIEDLIWAHPRYRLQARVFLLRHHARRDRVLAAGEPFPLTIAGDHAQGTLFLDGRSLVTTALERRIDEIAREMPGFHIGRFDIRYSDVERFTQGEDLAIVELNGVTSEPTNIYDPAYGFIHAVRTLCRQWTLIFEIGAANRARGHQPTRPGRLLRLALSHLRSTPPLPIAS
jgi:membrane protein DedA with SNARE-associated domain